MKKLNLQCHWRKLLLIAVCVAATLFIGYVYGKNAVETELKELANNLYGGNYYVDVAYAGPGGQTNTVTLSASGFRLPMHDSEEDSYVKETIPFIERHDVPYDISHFALVDGNSDGGFEFTFMGCPTPDDVFVQRWPRDYQGTIGTFTNGEIVSFELADPPMMYHTSNFEPGYIYSIYASWGPYYGEYAFLVSTQESDRAYWKLEEHFERVEAAFPEDVSFAGTIFRYGEVAYDIAERHPAVTSILSCTPVGHHIIVDGHGGPKNAVYCIFDTETAEFEKVFIGAGLIWQDEDIRTAVYCCGADIFSYNGVLLGTCDMDEYDYIRELQFSDDQVQAIVENDTGASKIESFALPTQK